MANVKISNLPVETVLTNMTGIAGYNASGTAQISGADIIAGAAQPDQNLASVLSTGSIATTGQTITLGDTGPGGAYTATMGAAGITINNGGPFDISGNGDVKMSYTGGSSGDKIIISTLGGLGTDAGILIENGGQGANASLKLKSATDINIVGTGLGTPSVGDVLSAKNVAGDLEWVAAGGGSTPTLQQVLDAGNIAEEDAAAPTPLVGKINLVTPGGQDVTFEPNGITNNSASALEIDANSGILTLQSSTKVNIVGPSGGLNVDNTGNNVQLYANNADDLQLNINGTGNISMYLGTAATAPAVGDVLTAKTTGGALEWTTPASKTPQTLTPGTTTWTIANGYNAILNNNTATTLSIPGLVDGDTGTLIVNTTANGTISWPVLSAWPGGTPPTLTNNSTDIFSFIYVFPTYYWSYGQDFS